MFIFKMCSKQLVFLFDLNAYNDFITKPRESLNKKLLHLRLACLRILTEFSTKTSSLRWGFKFFDSSGPLTQFMHKFCFSDVSLEAFETFESEVTTRYERHISFCQALAESSQNHSNNGINNGLEKSISVTAPIKLLQLALTQLLCEFQWENMDLWSPSVRHKRRSNTSKRNFLFLISNLKGCDEELFKYFGLNCLLEKRKFLNILLTQSLHEQLLKKADIHWVWLNTSEEQFLETSSKFLSLLSNSLKSIHGSLIPVTVLSQSLFNKKCINGSSLYDNEILPTLSQNMHFPNSLLPFSTLFQQSLYFPFYSKSNSIYSTCVINIPDSHIQIPVQVTKVVNEKDIKNYAEAKHSNSSNIKFSENGKITWKKIVIQYAVPKDIHFTVYDVFLCLPNNSLKSTSIVENFASLNENLLQRNIILVLECVTEKGSRMMGLFAPLSHGCALISIVDVLICFKNKANFNMSSNEYLQNYSDEICNFKKELKAYPNNASVEDVSSFIPKAFQMESIEPWYKFKCSQSLSNLSSFCHSESSRTKMESFHKMLQHSIRNTNHLKTESPKCTVESVTDNSSKPENETDKEPEILSDLSLEEMLSVTKEIYNSTITSSSSILVSARKIMKMIAHFFKKHGTDSFEEEVHNFMKDNFLMTARSITEKYEMLQDEEGIEQKIREYQIQVMLILEMEVLLLPSDRSNCVKTVTSFLRMMSFYCGATELNRLLVDIIRENYCHSLWDVLVEIGDELDIPIVGESDTSDSPDILSSELTNEGELFGSSSNISERSSSSACSRKENRKLVRVRSDISDTARSRQVLVPRSSPKKKKGKASGQKKGIRSSPRLASKKNNNQTKESNENSRNVRRNLFPKDKSNLTPRKHKPGQTVTPKKHLKLKPVLETPFHKQDLSKSQRRKSSIQEKIAQNILKEVAESPKISETAKGANKEILKKLHKIKRSSNSPIKLKHSDSPINPQKEVPSSQFFNHTPDRNRRLSLKIFSKILSSPTARMGLKRCTKRLFDQISPQKSTENSKKLKLHDDNKIVVNSPEL